MSRLVRPNVLWVKSYRSERGRPGHTSSTPPLSVWWVVAAVLAGLFAASLPAFHTYQSRPQEDFVQFNGRRIRQFAGTSAPHGDSLFRVVALGNSLLYRATFLDNRIDRLAEERGLTGFRFLRLARARGRLSHFERLRGEIMDARPDLLLLQTGLLEPAHSRSQVYAEFLRFWIGRQIDSFKGQHRSYPNANLLQDEETPRQWRQDDAAFGQFARFFRRQRKKGWIDPHRLASWIDEANRRGVSVLLVETPSSVPVQNLIVRNSFDAVHERLPETWDGVVLSYPVPLPLTHFTDFTHLNAQGRDTYSKWLLDTLRAFHYSTGSS